MRKLTISKLLCAVLCTAFSQILPAQNIGSPTTWNLAQRFGGSGGDSGAGVAVNGSDETFLTGTINGTVTIGNTTLTIISLNEAYVAKFAPNSTPQWVTTLKTDHAGGEVFGQSIATDDSGYVYVSGFYKHGQLRVNGVNYPLTGRSDLFVVRMDGDGNILWVQTYGLPGRDLSSLQLLPDHQGNVYALTAGHLLKLDPHGNILWVNNNSGSYDHMRLSFLGDTLYLGGGFVFSASIGGTQLEVDDSALFLCEVEPATGALSNARILLRGTTSFPGELTMSALLVKGPGEIYVAGAFRQGVYTVGACDYTTFSFSRHSYIARLNATDCDWLLTQTANNVSENLVAGMVEGANGRLWVAGRRIEGITLGDTPLAAGQLGYVAEIDPATGAVLLLKDHPWTNAIASGGPVFRITGFDGYAAYLHYLDLDGEQIIKQVFANDGGLARTASLETDATGIYLTASVSGKVQLADIQIDVPDFSMLIAKLNPAGTQVLWHTVIEGVNAEYSTWGNTGFLDKTNGKFYGVGSFGSDFTFGGQTYPFSQNLNQNLDYFVVQFDAATGNPGWLGTFPNLYFLNSVTVDRLGNPVITGVFNVPVTIGAVNLIPKGGLEFLIAKMNAGGNVLWAQRGGGTDDEYSAIAGTDAQNNIYLAAEAYSLDIDFNDVAALSSADLDGNVLLVKYNPDGIYQWAKLYGKSANFNDEYRCFPTGFTADAAGNTYMTGFTGRTNTIGNLALGPRYSLNNFAAKFNANGEPVWAKVVETKRTSFNYSEIDIDALGNLYCMTQVSDSTFVENNLLVRNGDPLARNALHLRFNGNDGALEWANVVNGSAEANFWPTAISVVDSTHILAGGYFRGMVSFDSTELNAAGGTNGYFGLLEQQYTVSVQYPEPGRLLLSVFPNPAVSFLQWQAPEALTEKTVVSLVNSAGRTVLEEKFAPDARSGRFEIGHLPAGVYYLHIAGAGMRELHKVVIERR